MKYLQLFSTVAHGAIAGVHVHACCQPGPLAATVLLLTGAHLIQTAIQVVVLWILLGTQKTDPGRHELGAH